MWKLNNRTIYNQTLNILDFIFSYMKSLKDSPLVKVLAQDAKKFFKIIALLSCVVIGLILITSFVTNIPFYYNSINDNVHCNIIYCSGIPVLSCATYGATSNLFQNWLIIPKNNRRFFSSPCIYLQSIYKLPV